MMRRLGRLFTTAVLALLLVGAAFLLAPRRGAVPDRLPEISTRPPARPAPETGPLSGPLVGPVDRLVIEKSARRMTAYRAGRALRTYPIALGFAPTGDKRRQGDGRTPEGLFRIDRRNASSAYHLSLGIDYPRPQDRARAAAAGINPGGDIFIHGQPNQRPPGEILAGDWTAGCIAVSDAEIAQLFAAAALGTEVEIRP